MDHRGTKRSRDDKSNKEENKKQKKTKKQKKSKKEKHEDEQHHHHQSHSSSLKVTATAEGKIMAQMLSTFSSLEQSRFEAFRRATFCGDSIRQYVAHCMSGSKLEDLVAHGQAEEITVVVSTLCKAYAQRLVTAASKVRNGDGTPISPDHVLLALRQRQQAGLDPGFYLQPAPREDVFVRDDQRRDAALAAQEEYDRAIKLDQEKKKNS